MMLLEKVRLLFEENLDKWSALKGICNNYDLFKEFDFERMSADSDGMSKIQRFLDCPPLTLTVAGTTSSGKSTVLNFMLRSALLPSDPREMSAGIVEVVDSKNTSLECYHELKVDKQSVPFVSIENASIGLVCKTLEENMKGDREGGRNRFYRVGHPIDIKNVLSNVVSKDVDLRLVDLPGWSHAAHNVIDDVYSLVDGSLWLFLVDFIDPDEEKLKQNVQKMLTKVKLLGASLDSILFVFTKFDVYMSKSSIYVQESGVDRLERAKNSLQKIITSVARTVFVNGKEGREIELSDIKFTSIAPEPALYALVCEDFLSNDVENDTLFDSLRFLKGKYACFIDQEFLDSLQGNPRLWSREDTTEFIEQVKERCGANSFCLCLQNHLKDSFEGLLMPSFFRLIDSTVGNGSYGDQGEGGVDIGPLSSFKISIDNARLSLDHTREDIVKKFEQLRVKISEAYEKDKNILANFISNLKITVKESLRDDIATLQFSQLIKEEVVAFHSEHAAKWNMNVSDLYVFGALPDRLDTNYKNQIDILKRQFANLEFDNLLSIFKDSVLEDTYVKTKKDFDVFGIFLRNSEIAFRAYSAGVYQHRGSVNGREPDLDRYISLYENIKNNISYAIVCSFEKALDSIYLDIKKSVTLCLELYHMNTVKSIKHIAIDSGVELPELPVVSLDKYSSIKFPDFKPKVTLDVESSSSKIFEPYSVTREEVVYWPIDIFKWFPRKKMIEKTLVKEKEITIYTITPIVSLFDDNSKYIKDRSFEMTSAILDNITGAFEEQIQRHNESYNTVISAVIFDAVSQRENFENIELSKREAVVAEIEQCFAGVSASYDELKRECLPVYGL